MSQIQIVRELLDEDGEVSREQAWKLGIKRLGAIIHTLRDEYDILTIEREDDTHYLVRGFNEQSVYQEDKPKQPTRKKKAYKFGGF